MNQAKRFYIEPKNTVLYEEKVDGLDEDAFEVLRVDDHTMIVAEKDNEIGYLTQALTNTEITIENLADLYERKHNRVEEQAKKIAMLKVLRDHAPTFDTLAKQEYVEKFEAESAELLRQLNFAHRQIEDLKEAVIEMHNVCEVLRSQRDAQIDDVVPSMTGFVGRDLYIKQLDEEIETIKEQTQQSYNKEVDKITRGKE